MQHAMQRSCHSWPTLCLSARPSRKLPGACTSAQCGWGPEGRRARCTVIRTTTCCARYPSVCTAAAEAPSSLLLHLQMGYELGCRPVEKTCSEVVI